ncbi:MAG: HNH endonuclease [Chloroflexi bacterium]|nr:HNH endonuclease [Chloroflexota bacterium]
MPERLTGKKGIRAFLSQRVGEIVTTEQVRDASGNQVQYGRRLRELRDEEGWRIESHLDAEDLKPGQYRLAEAPPPKGDLKFERSISGRVRAEVLIRNGNTCRMCGAGAGEPHPVNGRRTVLHVGHIVAKSQGGDDTAGNLRALCTVCNQGAKNVAQEPPSRIRMMTILRTATVADQQHALDWLKNKFKD